jgi:uracil-DNA glycosylase
MSAPVSDTKREMMLREMGITPIWKSRTNSEAIVVEDAAARIIAAKEISSTANTVNTSPVANTVPMAVIDPAKRAVRIAEMSWGEITAEIAQCTACKLCNTRTKTVPGIGNIQPKWMVIGEAPGENEDKTGEPFVGRAGKLLDAMLHAAGKSRQRDVFITNIVKCRPPGNRDPEPDEISACAPFLNRQIELAKPALFLAAGKFAGHQLLGSHATVAAMRAAPGMRNGLPVVVTYHPSYLLRAPAEKAKAWDDLASALMLTPETP